MAKPDPPAAGAEQGTIGVAMLGYAFMGKAHSRALQAVRTHALLPGAYPELVSISGRDPAAVEEARAKYGWSEACGDWRDQVADDRVALFVNTGPNAAHVEPTIAAVEAGKHVICEKPLAILADDAFRMWQAAERAGVCHMTGFNSRFIPAIRLAKELIEDGTLGEVIHFRARFLEASGLVANQPKTWRDDKELAGTGALGDLGSHIIDLARYLSGEVVGVSAQLKIIRPDRVDGKSDVDDAFTAAVEFDNGAIGTLEASRVAGGRASRCAVEIDGTRCSIAFNSEQLNQLEIAEGRSVRLLSVTDPSDPFMGDWWPEPGHPIGWGDTFVHEFRRLLNAITGAHEVGPDGADFGDGYRCTEICDAIERSHSSREWVRPHQRELR